MENLMVVELENNELESINGGFIPLVILGVTYTASQVAAAGGAAFLAGVAIGALVASDQN